MEDLRNFERSCLDRLRLVTLDFPAGLEATRLFGPDADTIHLWRGEPPSDARIEDPRLAQFVHLLSQDETQRMRRFHFAPDQTTFAFARGMLRKLLGGYLEESADRLIFQNSELGKPALSGRWAKSNLHFNVSHTRGAVVVGVCVGREIGVDIEQVRENFQVEEIAMKFFSPREQQLLMQYASGRARVEAFFRCWTRKEAWLKARGSGLSFPLCDFDVSIAADDPKIALATRPDPQEARRWVILDGKAPAGYAAAVAMAMTS